MGIVNREYRLQFAAFFGAFFLFGISMTVVGASLPGILSEFKWSYLEAGIVLASGSIVYFSTSYIAGKILDRLGSKPVVAAGMLVNALAIGFFAAVPGVAVNALLWGLVGFGQGFIEVGVNWSVLRMEKNASGGAMSIMHGAFAAGAVAGPLLTGILIASSIHWGLFFRWIAVVFLFLGVVMILMSGKGLHAVPKHEHQNHMRNFVREPVYWLAFISLFLYVGTEIGVTNWSAEFYVKLLGASPVTGAFMVSVFWMGLLAGRMGIPVFYRNGRRDVALIALCLTMAFSITVLAVSGYVGASSVVFAYIASGLAGFGSSCIYPFVITLVADSFPKGKGEAIGFASAGGGVGAFAFPYAMSAVANSFGIRAGFAAYAVVALLTVFSCIVLVRFERKKIASLGPAEQHSLLD